MFGDYLSVLVQHTYKSVRFIRTVFYSLPCGVGLLCVFLVKSLPGILMSIVVQRDSGNWRHLCSFNSCLLRTGGACCSYCLPLLMCLPCRDTSRNSQRQVCECAYFSCVWQSAPRIALAVHPTPARCGDWCGGSDVVYVEQGSSPDGAAFLPATCHRLRMISEAAVHPEAGLISAGHKMNI